MLLKRERENDESLKLPKPDPIALTGILFGFFITSFIYVLIETLAVPFVGDQYGWSENKSQVVVGVALMGCGLLASFLFPLSGKMARKFDERLVMLIPGFIPVILGTALFLPYPGPSIPMQECNTTELTSPSTTSEFSTWPTISNSWKVISTSLEFLAHDQHLPPSDHFSIYQRLSLLSATVRESNDNCTGCPLEQDWCRYVPQLPLAQLGVAFLTVMLGYPIVQSINQGLFSKMLGPRPQGLWMGVLTGMGGLARITGPIFVSYIYTELGTYWCFGTLTVAMVLAFVELMMLYPRLVPMKIPEPKAQYAYDGPAAKRRSSESDFP